MGRVVSSLWIGDRLSTMERLSIASFLSHGDEFHLYVYGSVDGVPQGTVVRDGNEVLPSSRIFMYSRQATYSGFSNYFRYKLLLERGGWWVDMDTVCLRRFDFPDAYVFSSEVNEGEPHVNCGMVKAPAGSPVMAYLWEECDRIDPKDLTWGQSGPELMHRAVGLFSLERHVQPPSVFCPIPFSEWRTIIEPGCTSSFDNGTRAVHLWNEMWRRSQTDKDGRYDATCLYEILKRRFLR
jgi:hypothetical protein